MNIDQLRERFSDEDACRKFFESVMWPDGRRCLQCVSYKSYCLMTLSVALGTYECGQCKRQFRVTTKTPMHCTKLPLWRWLQAIYYIINSSKGVSSVVLAKWIGVTKPTAWHIGHAVLEMMDPAGGNHLLNGVVELDKKYLGKKPKFRTGFVNKCGRGTSKQ